MHKAADVWTPAAEAAGVSGHGQERYLMGPVYGLDVLSPAGNGLCALLAVSYGAYIRRMKLSKVGHV